MNRDLTFARPLKCAFCLRRFKYRMSLDHHIRTDHSLLFMRAIGQTVMILCRKQRERQLHLVEAANAAAIAAASPVAAMPESSSSSSPVAQRRLKPLGVRKSKAAKKARKATVIQMANTFTKEF